MAGEAWPQLPWREWEATVDTLHLWLQIVGKVRMALTPPLNHWWHTTLYVTSRGLTTSAIPFGRRTFQVDFDFIDHRLAVMDSGGGSFTMPLEPKSVAQFYREFMHGLSGLGIVVRIYTKPVEVARVIDFELDEEHAAYDPGQAHLLWRAVVQADLAMKEFQSGFAGKVSPVHLFWGSFDIATSRYSGRIAPLHPGGAPNCPDWVMEEAYSREEVSVGWWPTNDEPGPAFYSYTYPEPEGFKTAAVLPADAYFDDPFGEFLLPYDAIRGAEDPGAAVQQFFQTTYLAGAELGGWDRRILEPQVPPGRAPRQAWTTLEKQGQASRNRKARLL